MRRVYERDSSVKAEADYVGIPLNSYYHWCQGRYEPSAMYLSKLADAGYDIYYILTGRRG